MKDFVQNIRYYVQIVWQSEKRYFVVFAVLTMAMAAGPIAGILLPKIVIRDILALDQTRLVLDIGVLAAISMSASFLISYYSLKNDALFLRLGFKLKETLQRKAMQMAFADTEDPAVEQLKQCHV